MVQCKKCGAINPDNAEYCQECGGRFKKFGQVTGNPIIDTIIWIIAVILIVGLFSNFILGPLFSLM